MHGDIESLMIQILIAVTQVEGVQVQRVNLSEVRGHIVQVGGV